MKEKRERKRAVSNFLQMSSVSNDLPLVTYVFNPNFSLGFQLLHLQNPSLKSTSHLWIIYRQLYEQVLRSRIYTSSGKGNELREERMKFYRRRIIVRQIFTILSSLDLFGTKAPQEKSLLPDFLKNITEKERDRWLVIPSTFLESLIVFLMDSEPYKVPPTITRLSTFSLVDNQQRELLPVLPYNVQGQSCFCDSLLVAMFIAHDFYDIMLDENQIFNIFPWEDKQLTEERFADEFRPWIGYMKSEAKDSACYKTYEKEKEETKQEHTLSDKEVEEVRNKTIVSLKELQILMRTLVNYMRQHVKKGSIDENFTNSYETVLGFFVSNLRKELFKCSRGEETKQEDISEMFRSLLEVGSWGNRFLPVALKINFEEYSRESTLLHTNTTVTIQGPDLPFFLMKKRETQSLQDLISSHLNAVTKEEKEQVLLKKRKLDRVLSSTSGFVRLPDVLPFRVQRFDFISMDIPSWKIGISVTIPENQELNIPIMSYSANNIPMEHNWRYRITAMACHLGDTERSGHYVLYFRYNGTGDQWYYYNDVSSSGGGKNQLLKVDIYKDQNHKDTIEKHAYLFWAKRL